MTYPAPTSINTTKGLNEIFSYVNEISDNWFSQMVLIGIFMIIWIGYYKAREDFRGGFAVAGYGTFVVSLLFWVGGLISGWVLGVVIGISIIGTLFLLLDHS